jgi:hypothetical protein
MLDHLHSSNLTGLCMPIFLEPDQTFEVCLDADQSKPVETRPVFVCLSQSMRGQRSILQAVDLLDEKHSIDEIFDATISELKRVVVGWRNVERPFVVDDLDNLLTYREARELLIKVAYNQRMDTNEKKD